jgi:adenylosuccinate lyase
MSIVGKRYASSQIQNIWSAETKVLKERELWIAVMRAQAKLGLDIPAEVIAAYEGVKTKIDLGSIERREAELKHDVKARIEEFNALAGHQRIHLGLTSRDVTENIEGWQIKKSLELTLSSSLQLLDELAKKIESYSGLAIVGRTHNVPAQLTTLGRRFASWGEEFLIALENLETLHKNYRIKGIKGAIGTGSDLKALHSENWLEVERAVADELGIEKTLIAPSQIYPRSLDFQVVASLYQLAAPIASIAINIRLMAGIGLVSEGRASGQVGSSAMPHKNNPRLSERVGGLFVLLKGYLTMVSEISGNQWNEGDVSESVVRRVALADSFYTIDAILRSMKKILSELQVNESAISRELDRELEYLLSSKVLLKVVEKGIGREAAHSYILESATESKSNSSETFFELLAKNKELDLSLSELEALKSNPGEHLGDASKQAQQVLNQVRTQISALKKFGNQSFDEISN